MEWILDQFSGLLVGAVVTFGIHWGTRYVLRRRLVSDVENAYLKLRMVCEPGTLNPDMPGNPIYMKAAARDFVNPLSKRLRCAGFYPPPECEVDDDSLRDWFKFLANVRNSIG